MAKQAGPILLKNYPITQRFGEDLQRYAQFGMAGHNGIDFATPIETTVLAGVEGKVYAVGEDPTGYGKYVRIWDPTQNLMLIFAHLNSIAPLVTPGAAIHKGNPVGGTGNTGNSTGPHLHFGAADTDSAGNKINRENGFDGWKNPLDTRFLNLIISPETAQSQGTAGTITPTNNNANNLPAGVIEPSYKPNHAGQTVSYNGNSFRSDDGNIWIFQGSDAQRAEQEKAIKARQLAEAQARAVESGVYLEKTGLLQKFTDINQNASDYGLADAQNVIIKGPYRATLYDRYRGAGNVIGVWEGPGTFRLPDVRVGSVKAEINLPPEPKRLPEVPITPKNTEAPSTTERVPATTGENDLKGTEPWAGAKAPNHKTIYNKMVELLGRLLTR